MRVVKLLVRLFLAFFVATIGASLASALAAAVMRPRLMDDAEPADDDLELSAVYDGRDFRSEATALRGGRVICWYAGLEVDLRGARLDPAGADLEVWTVFGGTRIRVPEDWAVRMRGIAAFGGAAADTRPLDEAAPSAPVLTVRHRTVFGGFNVVAAADDEAVPV